MLLPKIASRLRAQALARFACLDKEWAVLSIILASAALLLTHLGSKSLWCDEIYSLETARLSLPELVRKLAQDVHPPLHYLVLRLWIRFFGESEYAIRLLPAFLGILCLPMMYRLARVLVNPKPSLIAMYLLGISPFFILYARMARYFSMTLLGGLISTFLFLKLLEGQRGWSWLAYILVSACLLHTTYPAISILLAQNFWILWTRRRRSQPLIKRWLASQLAIGLLFTPWLPMLLPQLREATRYRPILANPMVDIPVRAFYSFYAFGLGETILPWNWVAVPGFALVGLLLMAGMHRALSGKTSLLPAIPFVLIPLAVTSLVVSYIARRETVQTIPRSTMFALPFFLLLLAAGLERLTSPKASAAIILGLTLINGYSLHNYYLGRQFHNINYMVPRREIVAYIIANHQPSDVIVADQDTFIRYYHAKAPGELPFYDSFPQQETLRHLRAMPPARIWYVSVGRFRHPSSGPERIIAWIERNYRQAGSWGFAPEHAEMQKWKARLLRQPGGKYQYKVLVTLYEADTKTGA